MFRTFSLAAATVACAALPTAARAADMFDITVDGSMTYHRHDVFPQGTDTRTESRDVTFTYRTHIPNALFQNRLLIGGQSGDDTTLSDLAGHSETADSNPLAGTGGCDASGAYSRTPGSIANSMVADLTGRTAVDLRVVDDVEVDYYSRCTHGLSGVTDGLSLPPALDPGSSPYDVSMFLTPEELAGKGFEKRFEVVTTPAAKCPTEQLPETKTCSVSIKGTATFRRVTVKGIDGGTYDPVPTYVPPVETPAPVTTPAPVPAPGGSTCALHATAKVAGRRVRTTVTGCDRGTVSVFLPSGTAIGHGNFGAAPAAVDVALSKAAVRRARRAGSVLVKVSAGGQSRRLKVRA